MHWRLVNSLANSRLDVAALSDCSFRSTIPYLLTSREEGRDAGNGPWPHVGDCCDAKPHGMRTTRDAKPQGVKLRRVSVDEGSG